MVINRFEGIYPTDLDRRLFQLLAASKVSAEEFRALSLMVARRAAHEQP